MVTAFDDPGSIPVFIHQFGGRQEEVHQQPPFGGVDGVELFGEFFFVKAVIAQVLPHDRPVFLFDMSVIILLIRS